jgi:low affinity Fe/Cu permease
MSKRENQVNELFGKFASKASAVVGLSWSFIAAVIIVIAWASFGPKFH